MIRRFIINPSSGTGISNREIEDMAAFFRERTGSFDFVIPGNREDTIVQTRNLLRNGVEQIIAVGGDGTVNAVVNGFFENGKPVNPLASLALAKAGTGCDYFKSIFQGSPKNCPKNCADWKEVVLHHDKSPIDVGRLHFPESGFQDQIFVNMASVGMVAEIVRQKERLPRNIPSAVKYIVPTLQAFFKYRPLFMDIRTDSETIREKVVALTAAKGTFAGGGMRFGGNVTLGDGLLDITVIGSLSPLAMISKVGRLYTGRLQGIRGVRKIRSKRIVIHCPQKTPVEFDGEIYGLTDLELEVVPNSLFICRPPGSK